MLSINTNLSSLIAQNSLKTSTNKLNQAIERMTSGAKINHAKDNAANYSIATNMTTKINAYQVAEDNCAMGLDLVTTAEESLSLIQDKLQRLRDLQEQASNGTYGDDSLKAINAECNALVDEINRIYETAEYNGVKLLGDNTATSLNEENLTMYSSNVRYAQYDDGYVLVHTPFDPRAWGKISFSDGTELFYIYESGTNIIWGDLVIPDTYTWSEENGYYIDANGNSMGLIIETGDWEGVGYSEKRDVYGIEYTITPTPIPTPTPNPSEPSVSYTTDSILLQIGIGGNWDSQIAISTKFNLTGLEVLCDIGLDTTTDFLTKIDSMLDVISEKQTEFGAVSNRLESALDSIAVSYDNLVSSRSTIQDADIAELSSEYIRQQILQQASATLMATANQNPSIALQLL